MVKSQNFTKKTKEESMKHIPTKDLIKKIMWLAISITVIVSIFGGVNFAVSFAELKYGTMQLNSGDAGYLMVQTLSRLRTFIYIVGAIIMTAIIAQDVNYFIQTLKTKGETK